ncbi:hypothetical protein C8R41DRAFT_869964 [Lentinula lateritia]|uniref:DNA breaking-rejoining enzyme n=1 Tax=Lentinula lateritia TaxID=40482 RepID=A0ABQ8V5Z4_9AGAR|nr:hypothetical protein C8R41DRAFT_869964 [Lentinula lateritia]
MSAQRLAHATSKLEVLTVTNSPQAQYHRRTTVYTLHSTSALTKLEAIVEAPSTPSTQRLEAIVEAPSTSSTQRCSLSPTAPKAQSNHRSAVHSIYSTVSPREIKNGGAHCHQQPQALIRLKLIIEEPYALSTKWLKIIVKAILTLSIQWLVHAKSKIEVLVVTDSPRDPRKASKKQKTEETITGSPVKRLSDLRRETNVNTTAHIRAPNTIKKYEEVIKRGRKWLEDFLDAEEKARDCDENEEDEDGSDFKEDRSTAALQQTASEFRGCLDGKPRESTPEAIAMFMSWKCYTEGRKIATANQIHAAFKYYYTHLNGDKYRGPWRYDGAQREWVGNPCDAAQVADLHDGCKRKDGEAERHHSMPASIIVMERLYAYSITICPDDYPVADVKSLALKTSHLRFRAYASLGFTIWTRNSETSNLQAKHIDRNPLPRPGATPSDPPFIQINLRDRKNWQKKQGKNETQLNGHRYNLYPQKIRAICAYTHLSIWMSFSEQYILRRKYAPEDYIFPNINVNGITIQNKPVTPEAVQKMINEFTTAAGVPGAFTTHCFRRGGAQYRFMFAPVGERWTLARIRWWGGWAPNEKRDTLIRYLLDELNTYEEDHSDALAPVDRRASESHAGEAAEMGPVSAAECRNLFQMQSFFIQKTVKNEVFAALTTPSLVQQIGSVPGYRHTNGPNISPSFIYPAIHSTNSVSIPSEIYAPPPPLIPPSKNPQTTYIQASSMSSSPPAFLPGLEHLPTIPNIRPGPEGWKQIVHDWEHADPNRHHHYALRDWKTEWAKATKLASNYNKRKLIATEFIEEFERDEEKFKLAYPSCKKGIEQLLHEIHIEDK